MEVTDKQYVLNHGEEWGHAYSKICQEYSVRQEREHIEECLSCGFKVIAACAHLETNAKDFIEWAMQSKLDEMRKGLTVYTEAIEWLDAVEPKMGRGTDEHLAHWRDPSGKTIAQRHQEMLDAWNLKNTTENTDGIS